MKDKRVCVIGLGYIGLPTASLLATNGYDVAGVDINRKTVDIINRGEIHIVEPDLDAYVRSAVASGRLRAFSEPPKADIYMICVPTPFREAQGKTPEPDLDYVLAATRSIARLVKSGDMIILESTSPVGTTAKMGEELAAAGVNLANVHLAYCPERVLPGKIMVELVENDRIVGGLNAQAATAVGDFYRTFVHGEVLETDAPTAEMCKLVENSYRDVNIAFANELSLLCARAGINVWQLIQLANRHPRVNILQPGTGVGGHCIAVDPWFIVARDPENARVIRIAREINNYKTQWVIDQIKTCANDFAAKWGRAPRIACFGLAFKPDIDDLRESPAVHVVRSLLSESRNVVAVEPNIEEHPDFELTSIDTALHECDVLAILVKHREFVNVAKDGGFSERIVLDFCGIGM